MTLSALGPYLASHLIPKTKGSVEKDGIDVENSTSKKIVTQPVVLISNSYFCLLLDHFIPKFHIEML